MANQEKGLRAAIEKAMLKISKGKLVYRFMTDLDYKEMVKLDKLLNHEDVYYEGNIVGFLDISDRKNLSCIVLVTIKGIYTVTSAFLSTGSMLLYEFDEKNKCVITGSKRTYRYGDEVNEFSYIAPIIEAVLEYFGNGADSGKSKKMEKLDSFDYED